MTKYNVLNPWWYDYVKDAVECIDNKDYQEARDLLKEILDYALGEKITE